MIAELLALDIDIDKDIKFMCKEIIKDVDVSSGWWYQACPQCKSSVQNYNAQV
ncbi:conserved hypothetical protein [Ricinus communis]|uniref:Uncharacterized protein n=1 Tax=Ricinus communis TaxID=3988 RepID=B9RVG4_RICCO|nr:conserved hypothetical protein [Ricinus communis]